MSTIPNMPFTDNGSIERLYEMRAAAIDNWSLFEEQDPTIFNESFLADSETAINQLQAMRTDEVVRDLGKNPTRQRDKCIDIAKTLWPQLKLRLKMAQKNTTKNLLDTFGANNYATDIQNAMSMAAFWTNVLNLFEEGTFSSAFDGSIEGTTAVYIPPTLLPKIKENRDHLDDVWRAMQDFPIFRLNQTILRNSHRTKVLYFLQTLAGFGKLIFSKGHPKYKLFVIRTGTYKPIKTEVIEPMSKKGFNEGQLEESSVVQIKNTGNQAIIVYAASDIDAPTHENAVRVAAKTDAVLSVSALHVDGLFNLLVVRNDGGVPARVRMKINN